MNEPIHLWMREKVTRCTNLHPPLKSTLSFPSALQKKTRTVGFPSSSLSETQNICVGPFYPRIKKALRHFHRAKRQTQQEATPKVRMPCDLTPPKSAGHCVQDLSETFSLFLKQSFQKVRKCPEAIKQLQHYRKKIWKIGTQPQKRHSPQKDDASCLFPAVLWPPPQISVFPIWSSHRVWIPARGTWVSSRWSSLFQSSGLRWTISLPGRCSQPDRNQRTGSVSTPKPFHFIFFCENRPDLFEQYWKKKFEEKQNGPNGGGTIFGLV